MQVFNNIYHLHELKFAYGVQINRTFTKHFTGRQFQGEIRNRDTSDKKNGERDERANFNKIVYQRYQEIRPRASWLACRIDFVDILR